MDDGVVVICPGVNAEADEFSRAGRAGGAVVKDGMEARGEVPGEKLDAGYSRCWSTRGLGMCGAGDGIGGKGSWP